jgi:hypothetical protein
MPAKSQQQQRIMGLALAYKRGEVPPSKVSAKVKEIAKSMTEKELEKYASTKHKGLPQKVVKESGLSTFEQFIREKDEEEIEVDMNLDTDMKDDEEEDTEIIHVRSGSPMKSIGGFNTSPEAHEPESKMMQYQLKNIIENAEELIQMIEGMDRIEDWMQSKVTLADDYISTLRDYVKHSS